MNTAIEIIPCGPAAAGEISEVAIRSYKDFYLYLWNDDGSWYVNRCFSPSIIEEELKDPNATFFLLRKNFERVGFLKLNFNRELKGFEELNCLELERIYLTQAASGKGYGREAMEFCFEFARKKWMQIIWLKAMDSSPAVDFYRKMGFEQCGSFRLDFELMKPSLRGMVIMKKAL